MEKDLVSIVILNYNGNDFLENCINSIKSETKEKYEIIVVDNASTDNSGIENSTRFPDCKFILNNENVGIPEGLNIGIKNSKGEFIIVMNNEVTVTEDGLDRFFQAYERVGMAFYHPKFL